MSHKDPVTQQVADEVLERDHYACVGAVLGMERECYGRLTLDHVLNGGVGKRGPSTVGNLVTLCGQHHWIKTMNAKTWRPKLLAYIENPAVRDGPG